MSTTSSKPAGPCHSRTAFTSIRSKSRKNDSLGSKPIVSNHRVHASSKYVNQWALKTTPWASTSAYRGRTRWTNDTRSASQLGAELPGSRLDAAPADLADLVVGEGVIGRAEAERERQARAPRAERIRSEHVEQPHVLEELAGGGAQRGGDVAGGDVLADDEGEVDRRRWVRRGRSEHPVSSARREQPIEVDLEPDDRRNELEAPKEGVVQLPDDADLAVGDDDGGGAAGREAGPVGRLGAAGGDLEPVEDGPQRVDGVEGVDRPVRLDGPPVAGARQRDREVVGLLREHDAGGGRQEHPAHLEETDV